MGIKFTGKKATASLTKLGQIKSEVAAALAEEGMPESVWILLSPKEPHAAFLRDHGLTAIEAKPIVSVKTGQILYNFGSNKVPLGTVETRLQGNCYLPADPFTVDEETHAAYREAKEEQAQVYEDRKKKRDGNLSEEELEAGESVA